MAESGSGILTFLPVQVAVAGTRIALKTLSSSLAASGAKACTIQALTTNAGRIVVGDKEVVAAAGTKAAPTQRGVSLNAGDSITLDINDVAEMFIDATANEDGVTGLALLP